MKILLIGPQGSGKGTQAQKIAERYDIPHISTGDIFRENIKNKTDLGKEAKSYIDNGKLVPDDLTNRLVQDKVKGLSGFILDGYPRNKTQAKYLDTITDIDIVLEIQLSAEETLKRLAGRRICPKCGENYHINFKPPKEPEKCDHDDGDLYQREDDKPEAIHKRMEIYNNETVPVLDYFKDKVKEINGEQDIENVFSEIRKVLDGISAQ
ncbi:MAG: adenylate kinase [Nanobdellota archaeon]